MTPHGSQCLKINLKVSFYTIYFRKQKLSNKSRLAIEYLRYLILFWLIFKVCDIMISKNHCLTFFPFYHFTVLNAPCYDFETRRRGMLKLKPWWFLWLVPSFVCSNASQIQAALKFLQGELDWISCTLAERCLWSSSKSQVFRWSKWNHIIDNINLGHYSDCHLVP